MSWPIEVLGEICDVRDGTHDSPKYQNNGVPLITSKNLIKGNIDFSTANLITEADHAQISKRSKVDSGDILFAMIGTVGNPALVDTDIEFSIKNVGLIKFYENSKVYNYYLMYALESEYVKKQIARESKGGTQKFVSLKVLRNLEIPLPPLPVQKQIAAVLEKADTLRQQCQQMEQELNALAQAVFLEMFGDRESTTELAEHLAFITSGSRGWAKYYTERGSRFIRSLDVQMNELGNKNLAYVSPPKGKETDRAKVQVGDVLLTITGSRIGRVCSVPHGFGEGYISQHVAILRLKNSLLPEFLSYFLSLPMLGQRQIEQSQYGQTKPGLNLNQIRSFTIPLATLVEQKQFIDRVKVIDRLRKQQVESLADCEANFNSLMQLAFKGELGLTTGA